MKRKRKLSEAEAVVAPEMDDSAPKKAKTASAAGFRNKEKVLVAFSRRRISLRYRQLILNIVSLLPHCKMDSKVEAKSSEGETLNELVELKGSSSCLFFECRKQKDLYMWMVKSPSGPSVKFLVNDVHTMEELEFAGNHLKGSRPLLTFSSNFDKDVHWKLLKEMLTQVFGIPKEHRKSIPYHDHVFAFSIVDGLIWFRNYQISVPHNEAEKVAPAGLDKRTLVEVGPRFCLNPIKIYGDSFGGPTLYENPFYVSPNQLKTFEVENPFVSSYGYEAFELSNGLEGMAISIPDTDKSFFSLVVKLGFSRDPEMALGAAHLLEHMVSFSNRQNEILAYDNLHGGDYAAFTSFDYMCFQSSVFNDAFEGVLQMFSQQLLQPNLEAHLNAEITAVDQEFELAKYDDRARVAHIRALTSVAPDRISQQFSWGNRDSLSLLKSKELTDHLSHYMETYFVGCSMKLVILGNGSLKHLEKLAKKYFGEIPEGVNTPPPDLILSWEPNTLVSTISEDGFNRMELTWMIPTSFRSDIVENLVLTSLSHKSPGSLYVLFSEKRWILSLDASVGLPEVGNDLTDTCDYSFSSSGRMFIISLHLTDLGVKHKEEIIGYTFNFLSFLRANEGSESASLIREEYSRKQLFTEKFFEEYGLGSDLSTLTKQIAVNMLSNPVGKAVSAMYPKTKYQQEDLFEFLDLLSSGTVRIDLVLKTKDEEQEGWGTDTFFDMPYKQSVIDCASIEAMYKDAATDFSFPPKNEFQPSLKQESEEDSEEDFGRDMVESEGDSEENSGRDVVESEGDSEENSGRDVVESEGVYRGESDGEARGESEGESEEDSGIKSGGDMVVAEGKGFNLIYLNTEDVTTLKLILYLNIEAGLKNSVLGSCYWHSLTYDLAAIISQGGRSHLKTDINLLGRNELVIEVEAVYAEHFIPYISAIWDRVKSFSCPTAEQFLMCKERVVRDLLETVLDPHGLSRYLLAEKLSNTTHSVDELLETLDSVLYSEFTEFMSALALKLAVEGVLFGPIGTDGANQIFDMFRMVELAPLIGLKDGRSTDLPFPSNNVVINASVRKSSDRNSLAKLCFQVGADAKNTALLRLFSSLIGDDLTLRLRFEENLGYQLACEPEYYHSIFSLYVVSSDHSPLFLSEKISEYVDSLASFLRDIDPSDFEKRKNIVRLSLPGDEEFQWDRLTEHRSPTFNKEVLDNLEKIVKEDVSNFYSTFFKTKPLYIRIWGRNYHNEYIQLV